LNTILCCQDSAMEFLNSDQHCGWSSFHADMQALEIKAEQYRVYAPAAPHNSRNKWLHLSVFVMRTVFSVRQELNFLIYYLY
jgi:hypothetical protein